MNKCSNQSFENQSFDTILWKKERLTRKIRRKKKSENEYFSFFSQPKLKFERVNISKKVSILGLEKKREWKAEKKK